MIELILTSMLVVGAIGLELLSRRLEHDPDSIYGLIVIAFCLGLLIWVPSFARSIIVGGLAVFMMFGLNAIAGLLVLGLVIATGLWIPGGVSVVLLGILSMVGFSQIGDAREHLIRLSRAATLVANEPTTLEVELTGKIRALSPVVDPVHGKPCAMWKVIAKGVRESDTLVELVGATGAAIIDPTTVRLEWSRSPMLIEGDAARATAEKLRLDLDDNKSLFLQILPEGTECYVVGTPSWEIAPPASSGLYRDNPVLPTFRSTPEHPAWFADRSEALLRADHTWALASWVVWAGMCAAIAATQIAGWT